MFMEQLTLIIKQNSVCCRIHSELITLSHSIKIHGRGYAKILIVLSLETNVHLAMNL